MSERLRAYLDGPTLRAVWWSACELWRVRRSLRKTGLHGVAVRRPPSLPERATRGVLAVVRRQPSTCLERALVLQSWLAAQGDAREVVIGVRREAGLFQAHAWVDGERGGVESRYAELTRLPAR